MSRPADISANHFRCFAGVASLLLVGAWSSPVRATDAERAQQLFDDGLSALDRDDTRTACAKFRQSMDAEPSVGALLNVAACSAREGKLARAADEYRRVLSMNESTREAKRRQAVDAETRQALRALQPRVPSLTIHVRPLPAALTVEIDSVPLDRLRLGTAIDLDPGEHLIRVTAPGFEPAERRLTLAESERNVTDIELRTAPQRAAEPTRARLSTLPGLALGGVGVAVLAAGGALLGVASSKADEIEQLCGEGAEPPRCDPPSNAAAANALSETGEALELAGWIGLGVGGAALSTGVALLVFSLANQPEESVTSSVSFSAWGPAGPGGSLVVRF